jgi:hypothetical protein
MEIALLCLLLCNSMKSHFYVLVFNEECKDAFLRVDLAWILASFSKRGLLAYLLTRPFSPKVSHKAVRYTKGKIAS